jgi:uncharacterized membrane protein
MPGPKAPLVRRAPPIFLTLGMAFLSVGLATDNTSFTWISLGFVLASMLARRKQQKKG